MDKDIFFIFTIEDFSIDIFKERELFVESFPIVFFEITIENKSSFFYKEAPLFSIDKLSDVLTSFRGFYEREPYRVGFFMGIGRDRYTFSIMQYIIKGDDLSIYFCDHELISEFTMYRISEVYGSSSFWKRDDITFWSEDEYLISKYIHVHFFHEFSTFHTMFDDIFDGFYPVTICGFYRLPFFTIVEVCCNSDFCLDMHIWSTDLDLCWLRANFRKKSYYSRME